MDGFVFEIGHERTKALKLSLTRDWVFIFAADFEKGLVLKSSGLVTST